MRTLVVGNGLAGTIFAKTLRELDPAIEIDVFAKEKYLYYPRPNLIEFLAGNIPMEKVFAFSEQWYKDQRINIHLDRPVQKIFPGSQEIEIEEGKKEKYDRLLLANGSYPFVPPFKGADKRGVFTLRTLDDAVGILESLKNHKKAVVVGGGLLGLEIARAIKTRGADVEIVEFSPLLLPRQLDTQSAGILKSQLEKMGIKIQLGLATEEFVGENEIEGLKFKGEEVLQAKLAIVAAGVRSNVKMAQEAGLETDRGLVVNDYMQTSNPKIFAAGDNVQHKGVVYGIIPASFEQARTAAHNILDLSEKYEGTVFSSTLKVVGLDVTSIGMVNPEEGICEEFRKEMKEEGVYKKIVLQDGLAVGAIWMGTRKDVNEIIRLVTQKVSVEKWKDSLLEDDFDFSVL